MGILPGLFLIEANHEPLAVDNSVADFQERWVFCGLARGRYFGEIVADCKRIIPERQRELTKETLKEFFTSFGTKRSSALKFICSDMWQPYLKVIAEKGTGALHVLDRFHIVAKMNKALDEVRAVETKELKANGYKSVLKKTRWCLLKRPENLTENQGTTLAELLRYNLKSVHAYLLKEEFGFFWKWFTLALAEIFMTDWCRKVLRSRIEPMKKMLRIRDGSASGSSGSVRAPWSPSRGPEHQERIEYTGHQGGA